MIVMLTEHRSSHKIQALKRAIHWTTYT